MLIPLATYSICLIYFLVDLRVECHLKERAPPSKIALAFSAREKVCGALLSLFRMNTSRGSHGNSFEISVRNAGR